MKEASAPNARPLLLFVLAAVAGFALLAAWWRPGDDNAVTNSIDFRAFYCAGAAIDAGRDPFRVEPVRSCEHNVLALGGLHGNDKHVLIAPQPPFALAAFALLARAPYRWAVALWLDALVLATGLTIALLVSATKLRPLIVTGALLLSLGYASLIVGQIVPLAVAAIVAAAVAARRGDGRSVAVALAVAACEPHVALPAWIGAFVFVPQTRRPLLIAGFALVALSFAIGPQLVTEYVTSVLREHARAQLELFGTQYGLASLLWKAGAPIALALALGSLSYVLTTAAGTVLGGSLARRFGDPAFALATPVALALVGGPFLHIQQVAAAIPLGLLLLGTGTLAGTARTLVATALVALAIPWQTFASLPSVLDALPHVALGAMPELRTASPDEPLEPYYTEYEDLVARFDPRPLWLQIAIKLPTWYGLIALAGAGVYVLRDPRRSAMRFTMRA